MTWFVLYVKAHTEKKVADTLTKMGVEVFCPIVKETRQWSDRKKKIETPLFKSYVFVRLQEKHRSLVFDVPGVVRYLFWLGKPARVRDEEILTIKNWLNDENIDEIKVSQYSPGDEITIKNGLFKNQQAVIRDLDSKSIRLILKTMGVLITAKIREVI